MKIKIGPKTLSIPWIRVPNLSLPKIQLISAFKMPTPRWMKVPLPKMFRIGGIKTAMLSLVVVAAGFVVAFFFVIAGTSDTPVWPEAGAVYALPSTVGQELPPDDVTPEIKSQTLQITLGANTKLSSLKFKDMDLGKASLTNCIEISRDSNNSTGYLHASSVKIINSSAPTFAMANSHMGTMTLAGKVDGHSQLATLTSTTQDVLIDSSRGAGSFEATDSTVDRILIVLIGDAYIGEVEFENCRCHTGEINIGYVKTGLFLQDAATRVGSGTGIDTASWTMAQSNQYRIGTSSLIDTPLKVQ
jgi:hypothetical protein